MNRQFGLGFFVASALALTAAGCSSGTTPTAASAPLAIVTTSLAAGTAGTTYSSSINVTGGTSPYTCSGSAPDNLQLNANSCTVTGTPLTYGSFSFSVTAYDNAGHSATGTIGITVAPGVPVVTTTSLPAGAVGIQYAATLAVSLGTPSFSCALNTGALPAGTSFAFTGSSTGCTLTGLPTAAGTYTFTVKVTDSGNPAQTATSGSLSIAISSTPNTLVLAGNTPMVGATVQAYVAGTSGNGSTPTALGPAMTTTNTGAFTLPTSSYTCTTSPTTPTSEVFLVATGGKPTSNGVTNPGSVLMTSIGACSNLASTANLVINEATTVAAAYSFAQFMKAGHLLGATSTNTLGMSLAHGTFANLVNPANGTMPGLTFPTTGTAPTQKINLIADAMNACLTAASPTGTACSSFYSAAAPTGGAVPTNMLDAALSLAQNPSINTAPLFTLASGSSFYSPIPATAPSDWTMFVSYAGGGMNDPTAISIDSKGRVWVASYFSTASLFTNTGAPVFSGGVTGNSLLDSYGGAVDANDNFWVANEEGGSSNIGTVTVINSSGAPLANSPYQNGGLNFPISIAQDTTGIAWIVDYGNSHLTLLNNAGVPQSGTSGYTTSQFIFPVAVAVDSSHNGWVANQSSNTVTKVSQDGNTISSYIVGSGPSGVAVDENNNVWVANYYNDSIGLVSSAGAVKSGSSGYTGGGIVHPQGIAIDGAGTAWVTNYRGPSLSELAAATASSPGKVLSPSTGWGTDASLLEAFGIAIDASGNLWVTNFGNNTLTEFVGLAVPVKTPLIGVPAVP